MPFIPLSDLEPEFYQAPRMDKMSPDFVQAFEPMAKEFYETTGRPLRVTDTFRTYDEQADLKRRKPYLAARPGTSRHELGEAMDIHQEDVPDVEKLGLLDKYGFHRPVMNKGETWHIELNPNANNMMAGPGATRGSSFIPLDKLDSMEKLAPTQSGFVPLSDLQDESINQPTQEILPSIAKNVLQPENIEFNPYAEPSQRAGEAIKKGIEATQEAVFWPLNKAVTWTHQNLIEPVRQRDITSQAGAEIPAPGQAAPEAFAPLPEEKTFVPAMEFALAPSYFKLLGRTAEVLGKVGKQGFYKYAPDWMFRQGEGGLPEILSPKQIEARLLNMTGKERAEYLRKYPEFAEIEGFLTRGEAVPETIDRQGFSLIGKPYEPIEQTVPGEIAKPPVLMEPQLGGGLRVPPEQVGIVPEMQNVVPTSQEISEPAYDWTKEYRQPWEMTEDEYIKYAETKYKDRPGFEGGLSKGEINTLKINRLNMIQQAKDKGLKIPDHILKEINEVQNIVPTTPEPIPTEKNVVPESTAKSILAKSKELGPIDLTPVNDVDLIRQLEDKGFYGTADRLKRGLITQEQAQGELTGELKPELPKEISIDPYDFANEMVRQGVNRQASWSKWIQRTSLNPGMDAKDWYKIYDSVKSRPELELKKLYAGLPATEFLNYIGSKLPTAATDLKYPAKVIIGSKLGTYSRRYESFDNQTKKFLTLMDKEGVGNKNIPLTENPGMQLASDLSTGRPLAGWKGIYATIRQKAYQERLDLLDKEGVPLENVKENYFPGMWTRPSRLAFNQAVEEWIAQNGPPPNGDLFLLGDAEVKAIHDRTKELIASKEGIDKSALGYISKRPFKGKESFRKPKFFADDIMDAVRFGLEPISTNPIVLDRLKMAEIDRNILAYQSINELKKKGMLQFNPVTAQIPEGKAKIDDPFGTVFAPPSPDVYGRTIVGHWIADQPVADVLNNYLSNTLYNNRYIGKPFTAYMFLGNMLNQFQLGMGSFFHGGFTSLETQITSGAEVIKDIYGVARGNRSIGDLAQTIKELPLSIGLTPYRGYKLMQEWLSEAVDMPTDVPVKDLFAQHGDNPYPILAKAAELAGGGFKQEKGLQTEQLEQIVRDWYGGGKIKAALRSPIAFSELLAKPLMQYWVPAQKAGVFAELAGKLFELNPDKTLEELMPELRQKWNRVDARLGQVRYNRLFIHNYGKNIVQALVRAPGWSGGTIAEVGGAPKDAIEFINEWQKSGKAPDQIPDRVAYLISLLGITAMVNGLLTYAFTGDMPQGMDWWAFRDGGHDTQGRPTRFFIPTYAKDLLSYYKRPVHTILAKMHPIIGLFNDIYKGTDYFNNQFRNPEDGWLQQGYDTGKYVLKQYKPFWVRNVQQSSKGVGGLNAITKTIISNIGVAPAPSKLSNSPDMDVVDAYHERFGARIKSKEEAAKMELKRTFKEVNLQEGADEFRKKLNEAVKNGELTKKEMKGMLKDSKTKLDLLRFNGVPLEVQIQAYKVAPPERQEILKPLVIKKYGKAEPEIKKKFRDEFRQIMNRSQ